MLPALREFVDAVSARDAELVEMCLTHTPPATLAVLAAGWVNDLLNELDASHAHCAALAEETRKALVGQAHSQTQYLNMRRRRDELRATLNTVTARSTANQKRKEAI